MPLPLQASTNVQYQPQAADCNSRALNCLCHAYAAGTPPLLSVQVPVQVSVPQDKANETVRDDLLELLQVQLC